MTDAEINFLLYILSKTSNEISNYAGNLFGTSEGAVQTSLELSYSNAKHKTLKSSVSDSSWTPHVPNKIE